MIHNLEVDGVQFSYNERILLSNIFLRCSTGKISGILGRNGQGKSTLLNIIYGIIPAEKSVRFNNRSIISAYKHPNLLRFLPQFNFLPSSRSIGKLFKDFEISFEAFMVRFTEFTGKRNSKVSSLSGGERRLLELYLIIKSESQFAILDEPFTHLDLIQIEKAKSFLVEEKRNKGIILTDHLYNAVLDISDEIYLLSERSMYRVHAMREIEQLGYISSSGNMQV